LIFFAVGFTVAICYGFLVCKEFLCVRKYFFFVCLFCNCMHVRVVGHHNIDNIAVFTLCSNFPSYLLCRIMSERNIFFNANYYYYLFVLRFFLLLCFVLFILNIVLS